MEPTGRTFINAAEAVRVRNRMKNVSDHGSVAAKAGSKPVKMHIVVPN
jgi:hypothetical protein